MAYAINCESMLLANDIVGNVFGGPSPGLWTVEHQRECVALVVRYDLIFLVVIDCGGSESRILYIRTLS